jgi:3-dehydroquinate synthase
MKKLTVQLAQNSYDIIIAKDILLQAGKLIGSVHLGKRAVVVTDENVWKLYGSCLQTSLAAADIDFRVIVLPPGESSKQFKGLKYICETMAESGFLRSDLLIAFGGGVVGDLAGFTAATYMRGMPYVQIPTTLLAQVDSAVGGKTAINLKRGKNLVGAFWQPKLVITDPELLYTLDEREFAGGMAEVIKYAAIASPVLFKRLEDYGGKVGAYSNLEGIIYKCCAIKANIVAKDELDTGIRMLLNFGHTFGHALEKSGNFKKYIHGEAIAIGMVMAAKLGSEMGFHGLEIVERLSKLLRSYNLPIDLDENFNELVYTVMLDKKNSAENIRLILLHKLGRAFIHTTTAEALWEAGSEL